jgi:hypothetical protein
MESAGQIWPVNEDKGPRRSHIIGKAYEITKENINRLAHELDEFHRAYDALNANCISLSLHESRMGELQSLLRAEELRLSDYAEEIVRLKYAIEYEISKSYPIVAASNEMRLAYIEHMKTKFTPDGSHFQADVRLNEAAAGLGLALADVKRAAKGGGA